MLNIRIKSSFVFLMTLGVFLISTQYTDADIFAERNIKKNKFSVTVLNFYARTTFNNTEVDYLYKTAGMLPGGYDLGAVKIKRDGSVQFKYSLKTVKNNGDDILCNSLNIQVLKKNLMQIFSGKLMNLSINSEIIDDNPEDWIFLISMDQSDDSLRNKICEFNFNFKTYRDNPNEKGGIFAQRIIGNMVSSGGW